MGSTASTRTSVTCARRLPPSRSSASSGSPAVLAMWADLASYSHDSHVISSAAAAAMSGMPTYRKAKQSVELTVVVLLMKDAAPSRPCVDVSELCDRSTKRSLLQPASGCALCKAQGMQKRCMSCAQGWCSNDARLCRPNRPDSYASSGNEHSTPASSGSGPPYQHV